MDGGVCWGGVLLEDSLGGDGELGGGDELGEDVGGGGCDGGGVELWGLWQPCIHRTVAMPRIINWYLLVTLSPLEAVMLNMKS